MRVAICAVLVLCTAAVAVGQNAETRFEAASIKRSASDERPGYDVVVDRVWCANHSMLDYIAIAHGVPTYLIVDVPDWVARETFDIEGKLPPPARLEPDYAVNHIAGNRPQPPFSNLLRERTGLRVHGEKRQMPIYELFPLHDDGQFGPFLCRGTTNACTPRTSSTTPRDGGFQFVSSGIEWQKTLAVMLSRVLGRPVIDRTGLRGPYSLALTTADGDPASLVTALAEQLGLALRESRATLDVLAIDYIQRPIDN